MGRWQAGRRQLKDFAASANHSGARRNRDAMDDGELITRLAGGDDGALRELFSRHAPILAARLRAVLPPSDVEDVLQETFLGAWKGASSYRPEAEVGGWLWGIARRQAAQLLRRRGPVTGLASELDADRLAGRDDPAEIVVARAHLAAAVSTLSPAEHEVWRLRYVEDRPLAEVAELTGVPEGTVKSRAHRARRLLRSALRASALRGGLG